jgi:hypothetical protein
MAKNDQFKEAFVKADLNKAYCGFLGALKVQNLYVLVSKKKSRCW